MEKVRARPQIISDIRDIQKSLNQSQQMKKIKQQVSTFIHDVHNDFSKILNKYEAQIQGLKKQSDLLRKQATTSAFYSSPKKSMMGTNAMSTKFTNSPTFPISSKILFNEFRDTAKSNFYKPTSNQMLDLPKWQSAFEIKNIPSKYSSKHDIHTYFPMNPQYNQQQNNQDSKLVYKRSKYQRRSQAKKHHQEQIVHFLQQRNKNLVETTDKMMVLIGKKQIENNRQEFEQQQEQNKSNLNHRSKEAQLNQSLSQICDSLNNSFVAEKARKNKQKLKKGQQEQNKKKKQIQQKNQKIKKQRALKSLLCRLRENANSTNQPQVVKASKLIPTGQRSSSVFISQVPINVRKNSKVMINPVPVHQNLSNRRRNSPTSPTKNPTPILKHSSNILSRSISGISAISLME